VSADRLQVSLADGVLTVTLNRPDKRNAIDSGMIEELHAVLDRAELDQHVRAVALRGAGKDFCAGMDLDELLASAGKTSEENYQSAMRFGSLFTRMRALPKPVVAIVHGRALAGGMGLATGCDIVLSHPDAVFGYPEIQRGFVPAIVMAMLRRLVGSKMGFDLVATGRQMSASDPDGARLVSRVLSRDGFEAEAAQVLKGLAGSSATALALTKRQFYEAESKPFAEAVELGARVNALARSTPDFREAIARFLKK
jgi:methylglutaconyl-CoA hydratase